MNFIFTGTHPLCLSKVGGSLVLPRTSSPLHTKLFQPPKIKTYFSAFRLQLKELGHSFLVPLARGGRFTLLFVFACVLRFKSSEIQLRRVQEGATRGNSNSGGRSRRRSRGQNNGRWRRHRHRHRRRRRHHDARGWHRNAGRSGGDGGVNGRKGSAESHVMMMMMRQRRMTRMGRKMTREWRMRKWRINQWWMRRWRMHHRQRKRRRRKVLGGKPRYDDRG